MKPYIHAKNSAKKYGGEPEDYLSIHDFMDSSKAHIADVRHRALFHHSFGIFIAERIFGTYITNSANKIVQVRDVAEDHVIEDLGFIPTVADYINHITCQQWMGGPSKKEKKKKVSYDELATEETKTIDNEKSSDISEDARKMLDELERLKKEFEAGKFYPNIPTPWPEPMPIRPYYDTLNPFNPYPYVQPQVID